ncbi:hypothetical protein WL29_22560 [Burkholderia ubonensis]|uniref:Uncharacterized protein n=1 Tax=Burkholderia ubonensis TaxID=101571 RepID=A0A119HFM5_9BURK|nr:hypothetical protein [Burkholderia ubonensis]KWA84149.1 hypothetical protein WL29_22560 [Burkholderia ubonensis]
MNVLIVAEKPLISRSIAPAARRHWPQDSITFVHAVPYGNIGFRYPRGLKLDEFPLLSEPRDKLVSWEEWACAPLKLTSDASLVPEVMSRELFITADIIVCACDADHTGAVGFEVLMRQVFGDDRALDCPALVIHSLYEVDVEKAFAQLMPVREAYSSSLEYGRTKRYFDWNWNANSLAILGDVQRRVGAPGNAPPMSKYALQLLYGLRARQPMTEGRIVNLMQNWPGTGRYKPATGERRPQLGSPASVSPIIENLLFSGFLETTVVAGRAHLGLSGRGRALLNLLHPDCEDADLPFRLHAWCEQGAAAKPAIDRYIKTFFGKQKRFAPHAQAT